MTADSLPYGGLSGPSVIFLSLLTLPVSHILRSDHLIVLPLSIGKKAEGALSKMLGTTRVNTECDGQPTCAHTVLLQGTIARGKTEKEHPDMLESILCAAGLAKCHAHGQMVTAKPFQWH